VLPAGDYSYIIALSHYSFSIPTGSEFSGQGKDKGNIETEGTIFRAKI
jgi:hypothetical protein